MYYCHPRDPNFTHYGGFYSGKQVPTKEKAEIIDTFTISAMQMPSPDPVVLRKFPIQTHNLLPVDKSMERQKRFATETKNVESRMPRTANMSASPFKVDPRQTLWSGTKTKFFDSNAFNSTH